MPVTAKLSRKFYERFGDDITDELVDWFNAVDLTYQTQLREMNELNWERFKATLLAETASLRGEMNAIRADMLGGTNAMGADLRGEMNAIRADMLGGTNAMGADLRGEMNATRAELRGEFRTGLAELRADLMRWMFIYWTGSLIGLGGLIVGMAFFGPR